MVQFRVLDLVLSKCQVPKATVKYMYTGIGWWAEFDRSCTTFFLEWNIQKTLKMLASARSSCHELMYTLWIRIIESTRGFHLHCCTANSGFVYHAIVQCGKLVHATLMSESFWSRLGTISVVKSEGCALYVLLWDRPNPWTIMLSLQLSSSSELHCASLGIQINMNMYKFWLTPCSMNKQVGFSMRHCYRGISLLTQWFL